MRFHHVIYRLLRLFFGLPSLPPELTAVQAVNLALFDRIPILNALASRFFFRRFRKLLPPPEKGVHTFCVGRSGSGKSEALKLLALSEKTISAWRPHRRIRRDRSLVVIDPHGSLACQLAQQRSYDQDFRQHPGDPDLIYLDPCLAINQNRSPVLNPFDLYGSQHAEMRREKAAQQLTGVLRSLTCKSDEAMSTNMETLLYPCLSVLLARPRSTLYDLLRFVNSSGNDDLVQLGLQAPNAAHRYFFQHSFSDSRFQPTRGAISTKVQSLLNSRAFAAFLATPQSSLNLEHALNSGKSIIVNCAAGKLGGQSMSAIGRIFVGMVLAVAFNRVGSERYHCPIRLIIDEMQHFVSDELITILTEARKYGLHLTVACQIVGQGISSQLNRVLLGNTALKILGDAGADSRHVFSREMGIKPAEAVSLRLGQFLIRHSHDPPLRIRFTNAHVDHKQTMSGTRWRVMKQEQIRRYYPRFSTRDPPQDENSQSEPNSILPNTFEDFIP